MIALGWLATMAAALLLQVAAMRRLSGPQAPAGPNATAEAPEADSGPHSAPGGP